MIVCRKYIVYNDNKPNSNICFCIPICRLHVQQYFRIFAAGNDVYPAVRHRRHDLVRDICEYQVDAITF